MDDCSGALPWPGDAEEQGQEVAEVQLAGGADTGAGAGEESGPGEQACRRAGRGKLENIPKK